jgi:signal transduction histidine kinase
MDFTGREPSAEELEQLKQECDHSLLAESRQQDFSLFLEDIRKLWEGVLDIEVIADQQVLDQLAQDPYCSAAAIEVVREAFSNAVRHGKANKATLRLSLVGSESEPLSLSLEVLDNGILQAGSLGFGLKTIAELSFDFELTKTNAGTCLSARLTLAPELVKA